MVEGFALVGFVGDFEGQESLAIHTPVLQDITSAELFTPTQDVWTFEDLVSIPKRHEDYVHWLKGTNVSILEDPQSVLMVGASFYNRCLRLDGLESYGRVFTQWDVFQGPFRWRAGTLDEFQSIANGIFRIARSGLYTALFNQRSLPGDANDYFRIMSKLTSIPLPDTLRAQGVFHWETRNLEQYELVRELAVLRSAYQSADEYDTSVREAIAWMREERLTESGQNAHQEWLSELVRRARLSDPAPDFSRSDPLSQYATLVRRLKWDRALARHKEDLPHLDIHQGRGADV